MKTNYKHYQITSVYKGTKNWNMNIKYMEVTKC